MFTSDDAGERRRRILLAAAFAVAGPGVDAASAEILASDPGGFALRLEQQVPASPAATFRALVEDVSGWWHPAHTYSGDALNLVIDARAGGCFCEALAAACSTCRWFTPSPANCCGCTADSVRCKAWALPAA